MDEQRKCLFAILFTMIGLALLALFICVDNAFAEQGQSCGPSAKMVEFLTGAKYSEQPFVDMTTGCQHRGRPARSGLLS